VKTEDEGLYPIQHGYWVQALTKALDADVAANNR
jgi:benzoate/toluate 1,2-dioxygenase alpha subunit